MVMTAVDRLAHATALDEKVLPTEVIETVAPVATTTTIVAPDTAPRHADRWKIILRDHLPDRVDDLTRIATTRRRRRLVHMVVMVVEVTTGLRHHHATFRHEMRHPTHETQEMGGMDANMTGTTATGKLIPFYALLEPRPCVCFRGLSCCDVLLLGIVLDRG